MDRRLESKSKFLSLVLRHEPGRIGLELDSAGWADLDDLVRLANAHGRGLTRALVEEIVATNDKRRFAIDPSGTRIRANQGHSVAVDLGLVPAEPPEVLFHGTATRFLPLIRATGLSPRSRQHVHLSANRATALAVGRRHGTPAVLVVHAADMHRDGHAFFCSANGVWLTGVVLPLYLDFPHDA
ncbi:RNA 2'-phosphotransferase [Lysobacter korlensis]|uniref:Probable RNA 2'-phosphotransferase n=1 Tax=Lysobacter korlensis TaxID=553636 RepID=A0ABV6S0E3_9GAMM